MLAVVFATISGISYGASDFSGGLASKRSDPVAVTLAMQVASLLALLAVLAVYRPGTLLGSDLLWGAAAGLGIAVGLSTFYEALALGPMSTAASVTGLVGSLIPVGVGLTLGEVPGSLTLVGVALAVPAALAVSVGGLARLGGGVDLGPRDRFRQRRRQARTRTLALVAGIGFGSFFVALAQTSADGGLHPLLGARAAAIAALVVAGAIRARAGRWVAVDRGDLRAVVAAGLLDCSANSFYLLALDGGSLTWVAAVVSLYPVATVLLARLVLSERIVPVQTVGLVGAATALVLVGIGAS
ncbi:MAG: EamA family transporter [Actinomycetota bacterium]